MMTLIPNTSLQIDTASEKELGIITAIYKEAVSSVPEDRQTVEPLPLENYLRGYLGNSYGRIFILRREKTAIGILIATIDKPALKAYIGETVIVKEWRGQGFGRMLLDHAQMWFREEGVKYISRWEFPIPLP